ncbi:Zinc finger C2H2 [Penicillium cf. griseofulvum]|uniref:C2H2 type master regulator of conidiophore development brlA n=1 Tax=Penicillium cf. griseofulvum TaxID=2972120 RepID=A0A9W9M1G9_9EURO|nr:Zinc finger C2H2 [Penicillium cf. griseofulvum]KAJ5429449.1 Zinc finger C2H2 [Penicillium cf. griseofulvum]KAJ5436769.1 Zinc finger C2H2 [Penicillium cf. griseofulvum]
MTSQTQQGDFCLECNWEAFHIDGKDGVDSTGNVLQHRWDCSSHETPTPLPHCEVDEACCDVDDCALDCGSVCGGFMGCGTSTVCSVTHCENDNCGDDNCDDNHCGEDHCNTNCEEDHCEDNHCENIDTLCFEDHCCDGTATQDCGFDGLFGLNAPLSLDTGIFSSTVMGNHSVSHTTKAMQHPLPGLVDPYQQENFLSSYQAHATHCEQEVSNHFECHDFQKDWQGMFVAPPVPTQTEVNPADVFHMLGMCSDFSICQDQHVPQPQKGPNGFDKPKIDTSDAFNCFHPGHHHVHSHFKNPNDFNLQTIRKGPHRNHHRCRPHTHVHSHPYSPYSRQSRSSISSHLISSPGETPPPLEGDASSVLTTPDFSPADSKLHICKWATEIHGIKATCGATFADCGALQEHLVANHMNTVNGAKGNGYYCCWEGCHRPDEPFSQKSKLQGHFLTHSNYKNFSCSVCGKAFARQATLDRHERSHRGDKPYTCKHCNKSFTDSSELKTHSRTHTGEKPFKCTWPGCSFTTGDSSNMSSHRLTHGERKHKCLFPGCTKSFTRPDQLKRHQRTTHKQESCLSISSPSTDHFTMTPFTLV